ncbi:MAG TPA: PEP-CTERM sorting domain-containing protein [Tepidisphaeraceae bacterium]|nr:PEP-CTERM sorting domain-containing protein [Tepidisphaeraceae bacterium]
MQQRVISRWALRLFIAIVFPASGFCAAVAPYNTNGFELTRFHVGLLNNTQDVASGANWQTSAATGTAAQVTTFNDLSQGVAVSMNDVAAGDGSYWWPQVPISPGSGVVSIKWAMFVTSGAPGFVTEGDPFFGISAFDQLGNRIASAGINAANGALAISDSSSSTSEFANLFTDALNTWHNYELDLNFGDSTFHIFVDGTEKGTGFGFVAASTDFGDADINAFGLTNPLQTTGLAYFDNYVVSVPEPSMFMIVASGLAAALRHRRATK